MNKEAYSSIKVTRGVARLFLSFFLLLSAVAARALDSAASGPWSLPSTWVGGTVPTSATDVNIRNNHVVTVDVGTAAARSVNVQFNGTLSFSRVTSSTLTLTAGDLDVQNGGTLDMGTAASRIPSSVRAVLVLAPGAGATRYGLIVENGPLGDGKFFAFGADKTPVALAATVGLASLTVPTAQAVGWSTGDTITIGQTEFTSPFVNQTEERVVTGLVSAAGTTTVSWSGNLLYAHTVASGVRVANLTRNVLVRSSGTNINTNSSYVVTYAVNAPSVSLNLMEFAFIGCASGFLRNGVSIADGGRAAISSATFRNGNESLFSSNNPGGSVFSNNIFYKNQFGFSAYQGSGNIVTGNELIANDLVGFYTLDLGPDWIIQSNNSYSNAGRGFTLNGDGITVEGNAAFSNGAEGLILAGNRCHIADNASRANDGDGLALISGVNNVWSGNDASANRSAGLSVDPNGSQTGNAFVSNRLHSNGGVGIYLNPGYNLFVGDRAYDNGDSGLFISGNGAGQVFQEVWAGFDPSGVPFPNGVSGGRDVEPSASGVNQDFVLKSCRVGAAGVASNAFNNNGSGMLSYGQDYSTGTLRVEGDYAVSGATMTLDYADVLYHASSSPPVLVRGTGHAAAVTAVDDNNAVSQVVKILYDGSQWQVSGSVSGNLGAFSGSVSGVSFGGQFTMSFTQGGAPQAGDRVVFALLASSRDAGRQKRLLFSDSNASSNGNRSRLSVAAGAGLTLKGIPGTPTLMDHVQGPAANKYYTLISSGAFTLLHSSVTDVDGSGLQLAGAGPVVISSAAFDGIGLTGATVAFLTLRDLASNATFYNVTFSTAARSPAGFNAFSVNVQGVDSALRWYFASFSGGLSGDAGDFDPNRRIFWADAAPPGTPPSFSAAPGGNTGEIALSWTSPGDDGGAGLIQGGSFRIFRSTNAADAAAAIPAQAQLVFPSTTAAPGAARAVVDGGLLLGSTYNYRLWAGDEFDNYSAVPAAAAAQAGRATPLPPSNFVAVPAGSTITLTWTASSVPPPAYRGPYQLDASTVSASGPYVLAALIDPALTTYAHAGLSAETTYYYHLSTVDTGGGPAGTSAPASASARTGDVAPPQVLLSAGPRVLGVSWTPPLTLSFTKPMQALTVAGAATLRRLKDNLGNAMNQSVTLTVSSNAAGDFYVLSAPALAGNSLYELAVATAALDAQGKALASPAVLNFVTLMDRTVRNVVTDGSGGSTVEFSPFALASDGYLAGAALPASQVAAATRKLTETTGDPFRTPLSGAVVDLQVYDGAGAAQAGGFAAPVTVSLPYADADGDGIVDGTSPAARVRTLSVYWLDEANDLWVRLPSTVDAAAGLVNAPARHFTTFALIAQADTDLSTAHPFPVPWTPLSGKPGITFTGLSQTATVRVYALSGGLVREVHVTDPMGQWDWDLKSDGGEPAASGVYYYEISNDKERSTGRLAVVR